MNVKAWLRREWAEALPKQSPRVLWRSWTIRDRVAWSAIVVGFILFALYAYISAGYL